MKCRICKRELKREPYRSQGIGPICAKKNQLSGQLSLDPETGDIIIPYDGGAIFIERVAAPTLNLAQPLVNAPDFTTMQVHTASGIRTNVPRLEVKHSPSGFNFGYGGSGPADWALNVMLMFCAEREAAYKIYQDFKWKYVAIGNDATRLEIPKADIIGFIEGTMMTTVKPSMR